MKNVCEDDVIKLRPNPKIVCNQIDEEGYFFDEKNDRVIVMNKTCMLIWNLINEHILSKQEILNKILENYDCSSVENEIICIDITKTINDMVELEILLNE